MAVVAVGWMGYACWENGFILHQRRTHYKNSHNTAPLLIFKSSPDQRFQQRQSQRSEYPVLFSYCTYFFIFNFYGSVTYPATNKHHTNILTFGLSTWRTQILQPCLHSSSPTCDSNNVTKRNCRACVEIQGQEEFEFSGAFVVSSWK